MSDGISRVVRVRSPLVIGDDGRIDNDILFQMMEAGLEAFAGGNDAESFLRELFGDDELVGMKINTLAGRGMSTKVEVVYLLSRLLENSGVAPKKQLVWDRSDRDLKSAGFSINTAGGTRCFGTDHRGVDYKDELVARGSIGGLLSRILTDYCSGMINVPILKDHGIAGITCSMKNYFGSIHNPNKYHENACDPYIADLNSLEQIRGRQRLIIVDCLKIQYHGGPAYHPAWAADYGGILIATDPVAVDKTGFEIIEELRRKGGKESLKGTKRDPIYINRAAEYGLGTDDTAKIELVEVTV